MLLILLTYRIYMFCYFQPWLLSITLEQDAQAYLLKFPVHVTNMKKENKYIIVKQRKTLKIDVWKEIVFFVNSELGLIMLVWQSQEKWA